MFSLYYCHSYIVCPYVLFHVTSPLATITGMYITVLIRVKHVYPTYATGLYPHKLYISISEHIDNVARNYENAKYMPNSKKIIEI